ncbi:hypothetical protein BGX38DRAFT_1153338, partial [Terfezia claveryi]
MTYYPHFFLVLQPSSYPDYFFLSFLHLPFCVTRTIPGTSPTTGILLLSHRSSHTKAQRTSSHPTSSDKIGITSPIVHIRVMMCVWERNFSSLCLQLLYLMYRVTMEALSTTASIDKRLDEPVHQSVKKLGWGLLVSMRVRDGRYVSQAGGKAHKMWGDKCRCRTRWHSLAVRALSWGSGWVSVH